MSPTTAFRQSMDNEVSDLGDHWWDDMVVVGVHAFNWMTVDRSYATWDEVFKPLHIQFLDRATGFNDRNIVSPDTWVIYYAHSRDVKVATFLILTPIQPPIGTWVDPYENMVTNPLEGGGGRMLDGSLIPKDIHWVMSINNPYWLEFQARSAKRFLELGMDAVDIDNICVTPFSQGGDFSIWSAYYFREYLNDRYSHEELRNLGIHNITSFDIREYILGSYFPRSWKVVSSLKLTLTSDLLQGYDILVLGAPCGKFSDDEIRAVQEYVSNGGSLFVHGDAYVPSGVNALLDVFGVAMNEGALETEDCLWDKASFEITSIDKDHNVTTGIDKIVINWGTSLSVWAEDATILASTTSDVWLEENGDNVKSNQEEWGPHIFMVALKYGKGKMVVMGDDVHDSIYWSYSRLIKQAILWLGGQEGGSALFDEAHGERVTLSHEEARKRSPEHPEWIYYGMFKQDLEAFAYQADVHAPAGYPIGDLIIREFIKFQHASHIDFVRKLRGEVKEYASINGRDVPIFGNQWLGTMDNILRDMGFGSIIISPYFDIIQIEAVPPTVPPWNRLTSVYKMGLAMGEYKKPVWLQGAFYGGMYSTPGIPKISKYSMNITRIGVAEAYMCGAIRELDLTGWPGFPAEAGTFVIDRKVPDGLKRYADFVWENRNYFGKPSPASRIAIIYSIPTFMWHLFPTFNVYPEVQRKSLLGFARALEDLHTPYDILIFGHPDLWDDSAMLSMLSMYDVLILPSIDCMTREQIAKIKEYVEKGGAVIASGALPAKDEDWGNLTENLDKLFQNYKNAIYLENAPEIRYYDDILRRVQPDRETLEKIYSALSNAFNTKLPIITDAPPTVEMNLLRRNQTLILHMVNYDYNITNDHVSPVEKITVQMKWDEKDKPVQVFLKSPDLEMMRLQWSIRNDYLVLNIPRVNIWNTIFVNPDTRPTVEIEAPSENSTVSGVVSIYGTYSDFDNDVSRICVSIDGDPWVDVSWADGIWTYNWHTTTSTAEGKHTISVEVIDDAGSISEDSVEFIVRLPPVALPTIPVPLIAGIIVAVTIMAVIALILRRRRPTSQ